MFKEYRKCLETAFKRMFQDILFFVLFVLKSCTFGFADYTSSASYNEVTKIFSQTLLFFTVSPG